MSNKPERTLRDGALKATIWKNSSEKGDYYTVDLARIYKDKQDQFQETNSFSANDLLKVSHLATQAYDVVAKLRNAESA